MDLYIFNVISATGAANNLKGSFGRQWLTRKKQSVNRCEDPEQKVKLNHPGLRAGRYVSVNYYHKAAINDTAVKCTSISIKKIILWRIPRRKPRVRAGYLLTNTTNK